MVVIFYDISMFVSIYFVTMVPSEFNIEFVVSVIGWFYRLIAKLA